MASFTTSSLATAKPRDDAVPPAPEAAAEACRLGLGGTHQAHPFVERELARDQAAERRGDRRADARGLDRVGEQRDRLERLDRLPQAPRDLMRRDALAEQLAGAPVARLGGQGR